MQPYKTRQAAHRGIASYIHGFCNPVRLHSSLGYLSPDEYARRMKLSAKAHVHEVRSVGTTSPSGGAP